MWRVASTDFVLVVDDDADIRDTVVEALQDEGCAAVGASDGRAALAILEEPPSGRRACLILLDLMMPGMDGWSFRREQLARPSLAAIPLVVISAFHDAPMEGAALGAAAVLTKPLRVDDIVGLARRYCACDV